jgi:hypothetical protein
VGEKIFTAPSQGGEEQEEETEDDEPVFRFGGQSLIKRSASFVRSEFWHAVKSTKTKNSQ